MEGIERISNKILEDAKAQVSNIEAETEAFVSDQMANADKVKQRVLADSRKKAEEEAANLLKRAESLASSERRKRDLAACQDDVRHVIDLAVKKLVDDPAELRLERYLDWIKRHGIKEGVIHLSAKDQDLAQDLIRALPEGKFSLAKEPADILGGLIVAHGNVEDNFTYDLIIHNQEARLSQLAQAALREFDNKGEGDG